MLAILLSAAATCFVSLFLGQAALRLAGAREWNWLAPAVGISVAMMIATPTNHLPGRAMTMFVIVAALSLAAAIWCLRSPAHRPPLRDLLAAAPVGFLVLLPFLASGRAGILGVSVNNDMAAHLVFVEGYVSSAVEAVTPLPKDYPLGPHAMAAFLTDGFGIRPQLAFSGWTMAAALINAWTVLAIARRASWFGKALAATVVGLPFLVAAYYGEGAFKEVLQAGLVLAVVLALSGCGPQLARYRWVPVALLLGGIVSVYSLTGLPWPLAFIGLWLLGLLAIEIWREGFRGGLRKALDAVRPELPAIGIALAVLVVFLLPQAERMVEFVSLRGGTGGISPDDFGNLVGPLPGWEALGVWNNQDFRMPAEPAFTGGMWAAFVLALFLIGTVWACRRGRWLLPGAAAVALLIWKISDGSQSPYVSAKALAIASPLLLLVAVLPLVDPEERRPRWWPLIPLLALALLFKVGVSDERALRWSPVGPVTHADELKEFRSLVAGQPVLFLSQSDFAGFELAGAPVTGAVSGGAVNLPLRTQKEWEYGRATDIDSLQAPTINGFDWVVTTRDPAGSAMPPQLRPVKTTRFFVLWHRDGEVRERAVLNEGEWPGAILQCDTAAGREIAAAGGVAAVRPLPKVAPVPVTPPGDTVSVQLTLDRGTWELEMPYVSPQAIEVTSPVLNETLPANLDRPGPRWRLGRVTVDRTRSLTFDFKVDDNLFTSPTVPAVLNNLIAIRVAPERVVPIDRACGRYVDWYRSER